MNKPFKPKIEVLDIEDLITLTEAENPRHHTDRNLRDLEETIDEIGLLRSIGIDEENKVLVGNGTTATAKKLGTKRVIVVEADGKTLVAVRRTNLDPKQKQKAIVGDNRIAETSEWNFPVLQDYLKEILDGGEIAGTGFNLEELEPLLTARFESGDISGAETDLNEYLHTRAIVVKFTSSQILDINKIVESKLSDKADDLAENIYRLCKML